MCVKNAFECQYVTGGRCIGDVYPDDGGENIKDEIRLQALAVGIPMKLFTANDQA
jgi:hypothetical protein